MVVLRRKNKRSDRLGKVTSSKHHLSKTTRDIDSSPCPTYLSWKSIPDWMLAIVLLVPALPVMGILIAIVRLTSRGPGLFKQTRMGKNGKYFTMYKIRTMANNAEDQTGPVWASVSDPRVSPVGRVLRKLHLDELPQLFNVLKREMSLVGPRPERPEFVHVLAEKIPGYRGRLRAKPGVTGLAQLNLPPDSDMDSVRRKLVLDLEYLQQATLFLDIRIILCTGMRIFKIPEKLTLHLFHLHRSVNDEKLHHHRQPVDKPFGNGCHKTRRAHPASDPALKDTSTYNLSETLAEISKILPKDFDWEVDGLDLEDPALQRCLERTLHRASNTGLHHLPHDNEPVAQPARVQDNGRTTSAATRPKPK